MSESAAAADAELGPEATDAIGALIRRIVLTPRAARGGVEAAGLVPVAAVVAGAHNHRELPLLVAAI